MKTHAFQKHSIIVDAKPATPKLFSCPMCDHCTHYSYALKKHIQTVHNKKPIAVNESRPRPAPKLFCQFCSSTFGSTCAKNKHMGIKHPEIQIVIDETPKKWQCDICKNKSRHMRLKHSETVEWFQCSECSKWYHPSYNYTTHYKKKHSDQLKPKMTQVKIKLH